ncbi:Proteoglycan 4, partial [Smittium culicis]
MFINFANKSIIASLLLATQIAGISLHNRKLDANAEGFNPNISKKSLNSKFIRQDTQVSCPRSYSDYTANSNTAYISYVVYDPTNVISIPCSTGAFSLSFQVENTHDLYWYISNQANIQSQTSLLGEMYLTSPKDWYVGSEIFIQETQSLIMAAEFQIATIRIEVNALGDVDVYRNDNLEAHLNYYDYHLDAFRAAKDFSFYIGTLSGTVEITNIVNTCLGEDCASTTNTEETTTEETTPEETTPEESTPEETTPEETTPEETTPEETTPEETTPEETTPEETTPEETTPEETTPEETTPEETTPEETTPEETTPEETTPEET